MPAFADPQWAARDDLFDFFVAERRRRERKNASWIGPLRMVLQHPSDA